jgi:hypothetical protein
MSSWRQQALIEAPVEDVWQLIADPTRYPEWGANVVAVTGEAEVSREDTFRLRSRDLGIETETTFRVVELEEMREIKLRCETSGYYSRWLLTEAQDNTFLDVEIGMEPLALSYRVIDATVGKRWYRRLAEDSIDGLRKLASRAQPRGR